MWKILQCLSEREGKKMDTSLTPCISCRISVYGSTIYVMRRRECEGTGYYLIDDLRLLRTV